MKRFLSALLCAFLLLGLLPAVSAPARMVTDFTLKVSPSAAFVGDKIRAEITNPVGTGPFTYAFVLHRYTPNGWLYLGGDTNYHPENIKYLTPTQPGIYRVYSVVWDDGTHIGLPKWSGDVTVTLRPSVKITKVEALGGTVLKLIWDKVPGATGYEVHRSSSKTGPFNIVKFTTATSFSNTYLTPGKQYFYKVRAYNIIDQVPYVSSKFSAIRAGVPLAKPIITSAVGISESQIKLTWNKVTGATGYQVFRSAAATGTYQSIKLTTALTCTIGSLHYNRTYYFKVRPYKQFGTVKYYGPLSAYRAGRTK